ncbi:aminodeoxychorismate lyase [Ammonifex degensii KC4]|uniref:Endolytic murein transglycosylase n=2 Tax=Ammonifex degensii TaxID=42838 RepID=C9R8A6_AMMDK|nr:endolytic transglycosylase MltG [Ammonifex degensii]ACX52535.1 aminodeoxychorismate lyase [Ammonifex degensii KC4]
MKIPLQVPKFPLLLRGRFFWIKIALSLLGGAGIWLWSELRPVSLPPEGVSLYIPPRASTHWVAEELYRHRVIRNPSLFRLYTRLKGIDKKILPGKYIFRGRLDLSQVAAELAKGPVLWRITVPEGFTLKELAELLESRGIASADEFWRVVENYPFPYAFLREAPPGRRRLEGYLFPDTYEVPAGTPVQDIIDLMLRRFAQIAREMQLEKGAQEQGLTLHQLVTLASLVEREAKYDEERPLIAGVLYHRLRLGMPLQVDATVAYVLDKWKSPLTYTDLEVNSPYNTYRIKGLPPGPIASPGRASLNAVLHPEPTDYLYYVAKPDGYHAFARTLSEHEENIRRYRG